MHKIILIYAAHRYYINQNPTVCSTEPLICERARVYGTRLGSGYRKSTWLISNQSAMFFIVHVPKLQIATIIQLFAATLIC